MLMTVLGLAIGISTANVGPGEDGNAAGLGIGAAIWSGLTLLIALFVGGMVATKTGMIYGKAAGMVEGVLIWVLFILTLVYMASSGIGMLSSGMFSALGGVTKGAATAVQNVDVNSLTSGDVSQITARLNDPNTAQMVATATGMQQDEARKTLTDIAKRVEEVKDDPAKAAAEARRGLQDVATKAAARVEEAAATAQPYASATLWSTLLAMILSLAAAVAGAMTGRKQAANQLEDLLPAGGRLR
jgi:flagellar basal body-associated protein FliL